MIFTPFTQTVRGIKCTGLREKNGLAIIDSRVIIGNYLVPVSMIQYLDIPLFNGRYFSKGAAQVVLVQIFNNYSEYLELFLDDINPFDVCKYTFDDGILLYEYFKAISQSLKDIIREDDLNEILEISRKRVEEWESRYS